MIYLSIFAALLLILALVSMIARSLDSGTDEALAGLPAADVPASQGQPIGANRAQDSDMPLRIFNDDDQRFIATLGNPRVEHLLRIERRRIALNWIRSEENRARSVMSEHLRRVRVAKDLKISGEIRLAGNYLRLLALCELLAMIVFFAGPAGLQGFAVRTDAILLGMRQLGEAVTPGTSLPVS
jgi:hypothetical protein